MRRHVLKFPIRPAACPAGETASQGSLLHFPVQPPPRLARLWFATGDPARPLASRWIATAQAARAQSAHPRMCRA